MRSFLKEKKKLKSERKNKRQSENTTQENTCNVRYLRKDLSVSARFLSKNMLIWCYKVISPEEENFKRENVFIPKSYSDRGNDFSLHHFSIQTGSKTWPVSYIKFVVRGGLPLCIIIVFSEPGTYKIHTFGFQECHYNHYGSRFTVHWKFNLLSLVSPWKPFGCPSFCKLRLAALRKPFQTVLSKDEA